MQRMPLSIIDYDYGGEFEMKFFVEPSVEVLVFAVEDVIAASVEVYEPTENDTSRD